MKLSLMSLCVVLILIVSCQKQLEQDITAEPSVKLETVDKFNFKTKNEQRIQIIDSLFNDKKTPCFSYKSKLYDYTRKYDRVLKNGVNNWVIYGIRHENKDLRSNINLSALDKEITTRNIKLVNISSDKSEIPLILVKNKYDYGYYEDKDLTSERFKKMSETYQIYKGPRERFTKNGCKMYFNLTLDKNDVEIEGAYKVTKMFHDKKNVYVELKSKNKNNKQLIYLKSKIGYKSRGEKNAMDLIKENGGIPKILKPGLNLLQGAYWMGLFCSPCLWVHHGCILVEEHKDHKKNNENEISSTQVEQVEAKPKALDNQ